MPAKFLRDTPLAYISLSELADPELVSDEAFRLIVAAFLICRYGAEVLCVEGGYFDE